MKKFSAIVLLATAYAGSAWAMGPQTPQGAPAANMPTGYPMQQSMYGQGMGGGSINDGGIQSGQGWDLAQKRVERAVDQRVEAAQHAFQQGRNAVQQQYQQGKQYVNQKAAAAQHALEQGQQALYNGVQRGQQAIKNAYFSSMGWYDCQTKFKAMDYNVQAFMDEATQVNVAKLAIKNLYGCAAHPRATINARKAICNSLKTNPNFYNKFKSILHGLPDTSAFNFSTPLTTDQKNAIIGQMSTQTHIKGFRNWNSGFDGCNVDLTLTGQTSPTQAPNMNAPAMPGAPGGNMVYSQHPTTPPATGTLPAQTPSMNAPSMPGAPGGNMVTQQPMMPMATQH